MLADNQSPRYLPHLSRPDILAMGLDPAAEATWIDTDQDWLRYHRHKLAQRDLLGSRVYRAAPESLDAQRELAGLLLAHLGGEQGTHYRLENDALVFLAEQRRLPLDSPEPLWNCSLWIADDLVIMQPRDGSYHLTAASLCSASGWCLEDKFGRAMAEIHAPIPGFTRQLTPAVERFLAHLKPEHPVVRYNWSLQANDGLNRRPGHMTQVGAETPVYYRTERQSLRRLPDTGAIAFTIRVYLHPLDSLRSSPGALQALFAAIAATPPALAAYKGFDRLAPALEKYRPRPQKNPSGLTS